MSLRDQLDRSRKDAADASGRTPPLATRPATTWPPRASDDDAPGDGWVPPGASIRVKGLVIPGGFLYVGRRLDPVGFGRDVEPALVDPSLPVYLSEPDLAGTSLGYLLSYSRISPRARAGYLHWLWSGRRRPATPIGYVFLYFYGLERRVLHDRLSDPAASDDLPAIRTEVERLVSIYGRNDLFRIYAARFAQCLEILARDDLPAPGPVPPATTPDPYELPAVTRFELARMAARGDRLPADWALAWTRQAGDIPLRTPAHRCAEQFDQLFQLRYRSHYGEGLSLPTGKARLRLHYRPASPSFTGEVLVPVGDLPDPSVLAGPTRKLSVLADGVAAELDPYSRLVGKHPDKHGSIDAVALLPPELATGAGAEAADAMVAVVEAALGGEADVVVDGSLFTARWPAAAPGHLTRPEAAALAQLLGTRGYGLEPDGGAGTAVLDDGPAVLFRLGHPAPRHPAPRHPAPRRPAPPDGGSSSGKQAWPAGAAGALLQLLGEVAATGPLDSHRAAALAAAARDRFDLDVFPPERVAAKLRWASHARPGSRGLKRRLASLGQEQRTEAGAGLVALCAAAVRVGPAEMTALTRAFHALGLDPADLFSQVHQHSTAPIPPTKGAGRRTGAGQGTREKGGPVALDAERIRARLAETADVAAFLGEIFTDDESSGPHPPAPAATAATAATATPPEPAATTTPAGSPVGGLDAPHSELLRQLALRPTWSRGEMEGLAARLALLPDGALDILNEAALDRSGEPVCEGDDPVEINSYALKELLT